MLTSIPAYVPQTAAYLGVTVQLSAYFLLQAGFIRGTGYVYAGMNLAAASMILTGLVVYFNPSAAISQSFIFVISLLGLTRTYLLTAGIRFSEREERFLASRLPGLRKFSARRLFQAGTWRSCAAGAALTRQGEALDKLIYIDTGTLEIVVDGRCVTTLGAGSFLGEMSILKGGPASATAVAASPVTWFEISRPALKRISTADHDLRLHLDSAITHALCDKLLLANTQACADPVSVATARTADGPGRDAPPAGYGNGHDKFPA